MRFVKISIRIFVFPVMLVLSLLGVIVKLATNLSCYIVGPFMLFLGGCCIYAIAMQLWSQLAILIVLLLACVVMLFGASWIIVILENMNDRLLSFIYE